MITLLASLIGFFTSGLPHVLNYFSRAQDNKQELALFELQIRYAEQAHKNGMEIAAINADVAQTAEIYKTYNSGTKWVDAFNATVRPVLAYSFFILYAYVKIVQFGVLHDGMPAFQVISIIWTEEDQGIFAGIIAFYFGNRTFGKVFR